MRSWRWPMLSVCSMVSHTSRMGSWRGRSRRYCNADAAWSSGRGPRRRASESRRCTSSPALANEASFAANTGVCGSVRNCGASCRSIAFQCCSVGVGQLEVIIEDVLPAGGRTRRLRGASRTQVVLRYAHRRSPHGDVSDQLGGQIVRQSLLPAMLACPRRLPNLRSQVADQLRA